MITAPERRQVSRTDCSQLPRATTVPMAAVTPAFKTRKFEELGLVSYFKLSFARAASTAYAEVAAVVLATKIASGETELLCAANSVLR